MDKDKDNFLLMIKIFKKVRYFKIPKAIRVFFDISYKQQNAFVRWLDDQFDDKQWTKFLEEDIYYHEFLKGIFIRFSGRKGLGEESWDDLAYMIATYLRTKYKEVYNESRRSTNKNDCRFK